MAKIWAVMREFGLQPRPSFASTAPPIVVQLFDLSHNEVVFLPVVLDLNRVVPDGDGLAVEAGGGHIHAVKCKS